MTLHLISSLLVDRADERNFTRMILPDEDVDGQISIVPRISRRNLFRQFAFSLTSRLDVAVDEWHADHAVALHAHRITRQLRAIIDTHFQNIARSNPIPFARLSRRRFP